MSGAAAARSSGPVRAGWEAIAAARPQLAATAGRYVDQIAVSLRPNTVIKTETTTVPTTTTTTTSNAPAAALAGAAAAASNEESSEEGGLPGWAWALIGAAAAGGLIWAVLAFRRRGKDGAAKGDGDGEKATGGAPPGVGGPPPA